MKGTMISNVRLAGLATTVPPLIEREWAQTGIPEDRFIETRRHGRKPTIRAAKWEQCQSDFCQRSAEDLMAKLGWVPDDIDVIVLVTLTPDYPIPATAIIIQDRLKIKKTSLAFDLPGGEATFLHGLQLVASMLSGGYLKRGLLLCGGISKVSEAPTSIESVDYICGHNGSVCALEYSPDAAPMYFCSGGDGSHHESYYMPIGGTRRPPKPEMFIQGDSSPVASEAMHYFVDMSVVEAAARRELPGVMEQALASAGKTAANVDHCFLQPISLATDEAVRTAVGIPRDRFHTVAHEFGYGSSGGIVMGMLARAARDLSTGPCTSLLAGIGAGLAWSSAVLSTQNVTCLDPIEME